MSPELLDPEQFGLTKSHPTTQSDCYALGMVIYEVLSGRTPFSTDRPFIIPIKILRGERPERPQGEAGKLFTDSIWDVVERCWKPESSERITAKGVLRGLGGEPYSLKSPFNLNESVMEADANDWQSDTDSRHSDDTSSKSCMFSQSRPRLKYSSLTFVTQGRSAD